MLFESEIRAALRSTQDAGSFASSGFWQEHDCAVTSSSAAYPLHCRHINMRPRKFREDIGNGTGAVVAVDVKSGTFAHPELGLLCGGEKRGTVFGNEFELRSPLTVLVTPECDEVHASITQCSQNAGSFAHLVGNGR